MHKVGIVGFGYIGSVIGACLAERGCDVTGVDVETRTVAMTQEGRTEHFEPQLADLISKNVGSGRLRATTDFAALAGVDYIVVTVGTPLDENLKANLNHIDAASEAIGRHLRPGHVVVVKSTVIPHVTRDLFGKKLSAVSGLQCGRDYFLAFSPERIAEGKAVSEFFRLPIVVGADDPLSGERVSAFWKTVLQVETIAMSSTVGAELTKLADNLWIDMNIAIANEIAKVCQAHGADFDQVQRAANTLPKGQHHVNILQSSIGVGGSCLTKDPLFFANLLDESGFNGDFIRRGRMVNEGMPAHTAAAIQNWLRENKIENGKIAVLGVAFKNDTNDLRFTPVKELAEEFRARGLKFQMADPHVLRTSAEKFFGKDVPLVDFDVAVEGAHVLCFACGHTAYRAMDLAELRARTQSPCLFVDGRHSFSRNAVESAGFTYLMI